MICAFRGRSAPLGRSLPLNKENIKKKKGARLRQRDASQCNENIIYNPRKPRALADAESRTPPGRQKGCGFPSVSPSLPPVPSKHSPQRHYLFAFGEVFGTGRGFKSAGNYLRAVGSQASSCSCPGLRRAQRHI